MEFLVVGAGAQGAPCASILSKDPEVSRVVLADIDREVLDKVSRKISSEKLTVVRADAAILEDLKSAAKGVDAIINLTNIQFNANIMKTAVKVGAHYVDTALDYGGIWKQLVEGRSLDFDEEFKEAGLTAVLGCGASPGLTNLFARYLCDKLDRVDSIRIVLGSSTASDRDIVQAWNPGWSPEIALTDYASEVDVYRDGKFTKVPPFSGMERYVFPDPIGSLLVSWHCHEESVMLPRFIGKGVKYVDFRYPVDKIAGALIKLGFASNEPIDVKGAKVAPFDLLMRLVPRPVNDFLIEDEKTVTIPSKHWCTIVEVEGERSGEKIRSKIVQGGASESTPDQKLEMLKKLGTTMIGIAAPAIVGAKMSVEGDADKGVIGSDCLDSSIFLKKMAELGAPVTFQETTSKVVSGAQ